MPNISPYGTNAFGIDVKPLDFTVPDALRAPEPYFYFRLSAIPNEKDGSLLLDDVMVSPIATGEDYVPRRDVEIRARSRTPRGVHVPGQEAHIERRISPLSPCILF